jgi:DNA-directed RNA polymerase subunit delta
VPKLSLKQFSKEQLKELSLIEMAYEFLKNSKKAIAFNDLVNEIKNAANISDKEIRTRLAQFYTDMNIDGRFLSLGENRWGLRVWYPVDTAEEEVVTVVKPKKKKAKKVVDEEEIEDFDELDDEDYDEIDDFVEEEDDLLDDDDDESFDELEELEVFEDEVEEDVIEDEEFVLVDEEVLDEEDELEEEEEIENEEDEDL